MKIKKDKENTKWITKIQFKLYLKELRCLENTQDKIIKLHSRLIEINVVCPTDIETKDFWGVEKDPRFRSIYFNKVWRHLLDNF